MSEQTDAILNPNPENNPKSLAEWTAEEMDRFIDAFSLENFKLIEPNKPEEEGYVRVEIPESVEPMARGIITVGQKVIEAIDKPLEKESQGTMRQFIGGTANATNASEEEEAKWIQAFGEHTEVARQMAGEPDPAKQDLMSSVKLQTHRIVTSSLSGLLGIAVGTSWEKYLDAQKSKYENPQDISPDVQNEIVNLYAAQKQSGDLINRDPLVGQTPRFVLVNSVGEEFFRSAPNLGTA